MSRIVFSTSEAYFPVAMAELRWVYPAARLEQLGPDTGCLEADGVDISDVAVVCRQEPVIFVRHLMREVERIPAIDAAEDMGLVYRTVRALVPGHETGADRALQIWVSGDSPLSYRADELWRYVAEGLRQQGLSVARGGRQQILSILVTAEYLIFGINQQEDALTDWPGGRVSLARNAAQISRAEFKLEELFKTFDIPLPSNGNALDLGASPGGWTRILRQRGLRVWAVDPAPLDPRIGTDPEVRDVRTTAGRFLTETDLVFDLIVNDMRMTVARSCKVMLEAATRLKPNGLAILTLKIAPRDPLKTVTTALATLEESYDILHARQLFHNRNEVTVVLRRAGGVSF